MTDPLAPAPAAPGRGSTGFGQDGIEAGSTARSSGVGDLAVAVVVGLSALAGAFAPGTPTGLDGVDAAYLAIGAGTVTWAGSRARPWALLVAGVVALVTAEGANLLLGATGALGAAGAWLVERSDPHSAAPRLVRTAAAACSVQALLRQPAYGDHGTNLIVGLVAVLPVLVSGYRGHGASGRRAIRWTIGITSLLAVVAVGLLAVAVAQSAGRVERGADHAEQALEAVRRGDSELARSLLEDASVELDAADARVGSAWTSPARLVPIVGQHTEALRVATAQGAAVADAGGEVARVGDYQSLKYESGRIDLDQIRALEAPLGEAVSVLERARTELRGVDTDWVAAPLSDRLDTLTTDIDDAAGDADLAADAVAVLPGLLGGDGERTYFVAFVTPAEQRGGGGFMGNFGELRALDGGMELVRTGPYADLDPPPAPRTLDGPEDFIARYGRFDPADHLQDATFSPHFPYTADVLGQLYPQSAGGVDIDGVISIDPHGLAALLELTGPIDVPGFGRVDATNAVQLLLTDQYLRFADQDLRKDLLQDATRLTFERLTQGDLPDPDRLTEVLGPMVRQRRIMISSTRPDERIGADGSLPVHEGADLLMVANQNYGNNKIDAFLERTVDYRATVDAGSGEVDGTVTIGLTNHAPASGLPAYVIGNLRDRPEGTNLMQLSIYSPLDLRDAALDGEPLALAPGREAGLNVYTGTVEIPATSTRVVEIRLRGGVDLSDGRYRLTVVPQSTVQPDQTSVDLTFPGSGPGDDGAEVGTPSGARATASGDVTHVRASSQPTVEPREIVVPVSR